MNNLKPVKGFENYLVSRDGYVLSLRSGTKLKPITRKTGYQEVNLYSDRTSKYFLIHRLVAEAFCDKPYSDDIEVNHIDGDKTNNAADNLEWVTHNENLKHAYEAGLRDQDVSARAIWCKNIETGEVVAFSSIYKAARFLGISQGNICMACQGKRPQAGGYKWRYIS